MGPVRRHRLLAGTAALAIAGTAAVASPGATRTASVSLAGIRSGDATVAAITLVAPSDRAATRLMRGRVRAAGLAGTDAAVYGALRRTSARSVELVAVVVAPDGARAPAQVVLRLTGSAARRKRVVIDRDVLTSPARASAICGTRVRGPRRLAGAPLRTRGGDVYPAAKLLADALDAACGRGAAESLRSALRHGAPAPAPEPGQQQSADSTGGDQGAGGGGDQPQPSPRETSMRWTTGRTTDEVVGTVTSDRGYDTLIVVVPPQQGFSGGPPARLRRITGFDPPAELPKCSLSRTRGDDDTLTCEGSVADNARPVTLHVRTDPAPSPGMGGQFSLRDRGETRGPYTITGP